MATIVHKYGGTSVGSPEKIKDVARRVKKVRDKGNQVVVIVSAMGHTTDELIDLMDQITDNLDTVGAPSAFKPAAVSPSSEGRLRIAALVMISATSHPVRVAHRCARWMK